ncbi:DUF2236 domain-containing protein [Caenimonas koreensis DSM 17982]|uniref:DUF2236 domain-containing protein n=2 Tax=Caenimonas TaxID=763439 RepID=A0A844BAY0_9BURK|nr:DUF2236 domain-containing protein [Caenimonas koreensis DSM 17982]
MTMPAAWQNAAMHADPLADRAVAAVIGPWADAAGATGPGITRLAQATRLMSGWTTNGRLASWSPDDPTIDPQVAAALRAYLDEGCQLPPWADAAQIERAENVFMEYGPMSCVLLFCASLPQCYVLPHLAEVLHVAGQLEARTEHRIRHTAAMVFPVMMKGGLGTPAGGGVAQVLKVRLIHATVRHLILRGAPGEAHNRVMPLAPVGPGASLNQALVTHGWDVPRQGLPCNQLELAYTLLTFGYVFLKGMRTLGMKLSDADERAFLHAWNVAGHVLGIRDDLMAHTMEDAAVLFDSLQAQAQVTPATPDVRPPLGRALIGAMASAIRVPVIRNMPVPLTRWLIGPATAQAIGVDERVGIVTRVVFAAARIAVRVFDAIVRVALPTFSLTRMFTRVVGYHLLTRMLLAQTRPLGLPDELLNPLQDTVAAWEHDRRSPEWVNRLEDRLTTVGAWRSAP